MNYVFSVHIFYRNNFQFLLFLGILQLKQFIEQFR